jgi:type VI secretion system protein ImpK
MLNLPPARMPQLARAAPVEPPAVHVPPPVADPLCTLLQPEVDQGLVTVICNPTTPIVRIHNRGMFAPGSAAIDPHFIPVIERVGQALSAERGQVQVIGYTDNQPIHNLRFPSNFQLSVARAEAAKQILGNRFADASRLSAEGRGEADPIATNSTPDGREQNRRIEIVLHRPSTTP